jgi:acyl carrier protein
VLELEVLQIDTFRKQDVIVAYELRTNADSVDALNLMLDISDALACASIAL